MWVRKFNLLPTYYIEWSKKSLKELNEGFSKIRDFYNAWNKFELVNLENYSKTSFFNNWLVIDYDWELFLSNIILSWRFDKYKKELSVWNIFDGFRVDVSDKDFEENYIGKIHYMTNQEYSKEVLNSVIYIDKILNNFVFKFK